MYDHENTFDIFFNQDYAATIRMGETGFFVQTTGAPVAEKTLAFIGDRIESYFE